MDSKENTCESKSISAPRTRYTSIVTACRVVSVSALLLSTVCSCSVTIGGEPSPPTLDTIIAAWKTREQRTSRGRFVWKTLHTIYPGASFVPRRGSVPSSQVVQVGDGSSFAFDGRKAAYRYYLQNWSASDATPELSAMVLGDELAASYSPEERPSTTYGQGIIHSQPRFLEFTNYNIWPFLMSYRMLASDGISVSPVNLRLGAPALDVHGREATAVHWDSPNGRRTFFADPSREFCVIRFEEHFKLTDSPEDASEYLYAELDITYSEQESTYCVPSAWKLAFYHSDSRPSTVTECTLTAHSINAELPDSEFRLFPFPEGTLVIDKRDGSRSWQRANGELEHVTGTPLAVTGRPVTRWGLVLFNLLILVALAVCYIVFSRRQRRNVAS